MDLGKFAVAWKHLPPSSLEVRDASNSDPGASAEPKAAEDHMNNAIIH